MLKSLKAKSNRKCTRCRGTGVRVAGMRVHRWKSSDLPCRRCHGTGLLIAK